MKYLQFKEKNPRGFSLVELLIVISLIAILSSVALAAYGNIQESARNAKRRVDVEAVSKALEVHYNDMTGAYPQLDPTFFAGGGIPADQIEGSPRCNSTYCGYCFNPNGPGSTCQIPSGSSTINAKLMDWNPSGDATSFVVCANLEPVGSYCRSNQR